jgi:hypothetical protein
MGGAVQGASLKDAGAWRGRWRTKYRKLAQEAREYAEKVVNPDDKHAWLLLVEEWSRLADRAEPLEEAGSKSDGSSHR